MKFNRNNRIHVLVSFLLIFALLTFPAFGAQVQNRVLVDGASIFIESGGSWEFSQGYMFAIKDVGEDGGVWVELSLDGSSLKDEVLYEGDIFVYSHDSIEIFNMTVDTIYYGSGVDLITFTPVFQYEDPSLPSPPPDDPKSSSNGSNTSSNPDENTADIIPGFGLTMAISCMIVLFISSRFFGGK
ncbi:S-layer protein domain-containing protein [Methanococcoides methylutens]|uniref:S-layer protein domain-containing protein n=1 Tax=Methanococcoides methylutens TaxID=2226 RepID=UPI004043D1FE